MSTTKEIIKSLAEKKYEDFRVHTKNVLMEKAITKIDERKVIVAKNYLK